MELVPGLSRPICAIKAVGNDDLAAGSRAPMVRTADAQRTAVHVRPDCRTQRCGRARPSAAPEAGSPGIYGSASGVWFWLLAIQDVGSFLQVAFYQACRVSENGHVVFGLGRPRCVRPQARSGEWICALALLAGVLARKRGSAVLFGHAGKFGEPFARCIVAFA